MPAERYYTEDSLEEGTPLTLQGGEHHHLAHVMRAEVGGQHRTCEWQRTTSHRCGCKDREEKR